MKQKIDFSTEKDRIHIFTNNIEWTILKKFADDRGPCYISDVRTSKRQLMVDDRMPSKPGQPAHSINVTTRGGIFGFGLVACKPPLDYDWSKYTSQDFWNWGWELTTRLDGFYSGFGITDPSVGIIKTGDVVMVTSCANLCCLNYKVAWLVWRYKFYKTGKVLCKFSFISTNSLPGLFVKEPKIVCNGLLDMKYMSVFNDFDTLLLPQYDLEALTDPTKHTKQLPWPNRRRVIFCGKDSPLVWHFRNNMGLDKWRQDRDELPPMTDILTPKYCLNSSGRLKAQWEVPKFKGINRVGVVMHVDEGGYGAPDCLKCFRAWPPAGTTYTCDLSASVVGGV